jgi:hypothetical protein
MEFFNRKEEVIDIELTSHGKQLLSRGKFKPAYYAFYDDDITYDSQYGAGQENQKDTHDRIVSTPRVKPNTVYQGVDKEFTQYSIFYNSILSAFNDISGLISVPIAQLINYGYYMDALSSQVDEREMAYVPEKKKDYVLPLPMGTSDLGNQKAPAWQINFMRSELKNSESTYVDGNRAVGFLKFDTKIGTATNLGGTSFTLVDASKRDYTFTFNILADPTSGTCTANPLLICLDVNNDNSVSTTSNQIAQQVRDKINAHPILITADIPNNDGVVRLIQDAAGDIGNTTISTSVALNMFTITDFTQGVDPTFAVYSMPMMYDKFTDFLGLSEADELNKLKFASNSRFVKFDNFLYDNVLKTSFNPDPSYSEYFFDITVDDEIQGDISSIGISQADIPINDEELCEDQ